MLRTLSTAVALLGWAAAALPQSQEACELPDVPLAASLLQPRAHSSGGVRQPAPPQPADKPPAPTPKVLDSPGGNHVPPPTEPSSTLSPDAVTTVPANTTEEPANITSKQAETPATTTEKQQVSATSTSETKEEPAATTAKKEQEPATTTTEERQEPVKTTPEGKKEEEKSGCLRLDSLFLLVPLLVLPMM